MTSKFWGIIDVEFLEVIVLVFINEFKSSALFYDDITLRSHRRVSVGASRGSVLGRDNIYICC